MDGCLFWVKPTLVTRELLTWTTEIDESAGSARTFSPCNGGMRLELLEMLLIEVDNGCKGRMKLGSYGNKP